MEVLEYLFKFVRCNDSEYSYFKCEEQIDIYTTRVLKSLEHKISENQIEKIKKWCAQQIRNIPHEYRVSDNNKYQLYGINILNLNRPQGSFKSQDLKQLLPKKTIILLPQHHQKWIHPQMRAIYKWYSKNLHNIPK